jgi:amino-acid N-acetyltransferase
MAAFNVATRFMTGLSASRIDAVIGNFVRARGRGIVNGLDTENTGTVDKVFTTSLKHVLDLGIVPILSCIGWSSIGKPYNVPSKEIAVEVSAALGAEKLLIIRSYDEFSGLTVPNGIELDDSGRILRLTPVEAEKLLAANAGNDEAGSMGKKLEALHIAIAATKRGVERVHIIDGRKDGALLQELFSNLGCGTMVYNDEYDSIRAIHSSDIPDILHLMEPLMDADVLLRRTADDIQKSMADYVVFEIDNRIHACGALRDWGEGKCEITSLAADINYANMGLGRRIVKYLIENARKKNYTEVFALTVRAQDWFESLGFREGSVDELPSQKREKYNYARNSKIYFLPLE